MKHLLLLIFMLCCTAVSGQTDFPLVVNETRSKNRVVIEPRDFTSSSSGVLRGKHEELRYWSPREYWTKKMIDIRDRCVPRDKMGQFQLIRSPWSCKWIVVGDGSVVYLRLRLDKKAYALLTPRQVSRLYHALWNIKFPVDSVKDDVYYAPSFLFRQYR